MKNFRSHFKFNKQERSGIFFLILLIGVFQVGHFTYRTFSKEQGIFKVSVDSLTQAKIDSLKKNALQTDSLKIFPFNPNFITDYKGYSLGMSVEQIDKLHAYRNENKFVNSAEEFQRITQVSDSLLATMVPYFKFPEWTQNEKKIVSQLAQSAPVTIQDLNAASIEDLKRIKGIGDQLSSRIVKFRDRLGGFLVKEQLYDVYGLEAAVAERTLKHFQVLSMPEIERININTASVSELVKLVYIRYAVAQKMVAYRQLNGKFKSVDELINIEDFPADKIDRIALYLSL